MATPRSLVQAIQMANQHCKQSMPNDKNALSADHTRTNILKLCLELYSGANINSIRSSEVYRKLRSRMEVSYFRLTGQNLP